MVYIKPSYRKCINSIILVFAVLVFSSINSHNKLFTNKFTGRTRYGPFVLLTIAIYGGMFAEIALFVEAIFRPAQTKPFHSGILMLTFIYGLLHVVSIFYLMNFILEHCHYDNTGVWLVMGCCFVATIALFGDFIYSWQQK